MKETAGMKIKSKKFLKDMGSRFVIDSSILIYHLEDIRPYSDLTELLISSINMDKTKAYISVISITEILTGPYSRGETDTILAFNMFINSLSNLEIVPVDYLLAQDAARLRGIYKFRTPDAILFATAIKRQTFTFITNDRHFKKQNQSIIEGIRVILLDDYIA